MQVLGLVGWAVSRDGLANGDGDARTIIGSRNGRVHPMNGVEVDGQFLHQHRFHVNLLAVLERESCPVRNVLGEGRVVKELERARTLRNAWKEDGREDVVIDGDELRDLLECVLLGMDLAKPIVQREGQVSAGAQEDADMLDVPWEVVVEEDDMEVEYF